MKKGIFLVFLVLLVVPVYANVYTQTNIYFTVAGKEYYLIPKILCHQNLVKNQEEAITIVVWKQKLDAAPFRIYYPNATVTGTITLPSGITENITFINNNNGSYTYNYTFDTIGTYRLDIKAENISDVGYSLSRAYIYVGKFPINVKIIGSTEYKTNEDGEIDVYVEDENGNPILGGVGNVSIYYPNKTIWLNGSLTEIADGMYYYNFTTPNITGIFLSFVNFTSGSNSDYDSHSFHVAEWAETITNINETVSQINQTTSNINETVADINETVTNIYSYLTGNITTMLADVRNMVNCTNESGICTKLDNITLLVDSLESGQADLNTTIQAILTNTGDLKNMHDCSYFPNTQICVKLDNIYNYLEDEISGDIEDVGKDVSKTQKDVGTLKRLADSIRVNIYIIAGIVIVLIILFYLISLYKKKEEETEYVEVEEI